MNCLVRPDKFRVVVELIWKRFDKYISIWNHHVWCKSAGHLYWRQVFRLQILWKVAHLYMSYWLIKPDRRGKLVLFSKSLSFSDTFWVVVVVIWEIFDTNLTIWKGPTSAKNFRQIVENSLKKRKSTLWASKILTLLINSDMLIRFFNSLTFSDRFRVVKLVIWKIFDKDMNIWKCKIWHQVTNVKRFIWVKTEMIILVTIYQFFF